ncbi:hypothetical protein SAMN04489724_4667 [Algoriphagus locisalis]|uniref:DUF4221 domain-containing protein n=1 Tax=Algoriphagus locisalis TaxID=305507 RepID=A0A1I7E0R5_9BACT|nr:hypothetical protein [Algoriphagus locisalis]SFU17530.1 hypothetical protein SAMN04489724_4667 [Algoriphagus locisalis]
MKFITPQLAIGTVAISFFACSQNSESNQKQKSFSLEITDSVQVDYLGEMMLLDYDPKKDKYLLANDAYYEYLEVDSEGEILIHNKFNEDGVDAVGQALGLGYFNGDVTVFNPPKGYFRFQDSSKVGEISIPYPFQVFMMYPKLGVFESGDKIYYPKPWPETLAVNMDEGEFYQELYRLPIIESQDKTTGDTLGALSLPESSDLLGDQVHGFPIPVYTKDQDKLLLSMWFEPRFYVYKKVGDQFEFEKTVEVDVPDWVPYTPVSLDKAEQFFEINGKKRTGILTNILVAGDYYIAVYNRGLSEEEMNELGPPTRDGLAIRKKNPNYAAIFDKNFNQLATNVPFPTASNYPNVVNRDGELVVSKVAGMSETEDDGIILYKLNLKVE